MNRPDTLLHGPPPTLPRLFLSQFRVDEASPFKRYLNRLEVEIGKEDYRHLKRVELLSGTPREQEFQAMEEITERVLKTTQNNYNRELLKRLKVRIYLDIGNYAVFYRLPDRRVKFVATWRQQVLTRLFGKVPSRNTGWCPATGQLPGFEASFLADESGGIILLRRKNPGPDSTLLTATHGPYDPHTLEVTFYFLRSGKGDAAIINLGFSGREPLADENVEKLKNWGIPLNPSNVDVIFPYVDRHGHPYCYKLEERLPELVAALGMAPPDLILDIHGYVGTRTDDHRILVGLGGLPPFPGPEGLGRLEEKGSLFHLLPRERLKSGLSMVRDLSEEIFVQFCGSPHRCFHFFMLGGLQLLGRCIDPRGQVASLIPQEERTYLPEEDIRWLPGAGGNALQRLQAGRMRADTLCLHVEIPTAVRRKIALKLHELEIGDSLDASGL